MSSLECTSTTCTFTRVDTDGYAPYYNTDFPYPTEYPSYYDDEANEKNTIEMEPTPSPSPDTKFTPYPTHDYSDYPTDDYSDYPTYDYTTIAPWTDPENQDILSDTVALTRDYWGSLFNAYEPYDNYYGPAGTEWALLPEGRTFEEAKCDLYFCDWMSCFAQYDEQHMAGRKGVVHLLAEDVYYNIEFTQWTSDEGGWNALGGGFQYIRDKDPFSASGFEDCPKCDSAVASPDKLIGDRDGSFATVKVDGVTPATTSIEIKSVTQDQDPRCNVKAADGSVLPNAMNNTKSTVMLRRTKLAGQVAPFWYTIHFKATNEVGSCSGQVRACVPAEGYDDCDTWLGYDAFATESCGYY
jgi:hypothetical protein